MSSVIIIEIMILYTVIFKPWKSMSLLCIVSANNYNITCVCVYLSYSSGWYPYHEIAINTLQNENVYYWECINTNFTNHASLWYIVYPFRRIALKCLNNYTHIMGLSLALVLLFSIFMFLSNHYWWLVVIFLACRLEL